MFKKGDKVLVEGVVEQTNGSGGYDILLAGYEVDTVFMAQHEIRPWTERPAPPVTVLWTDVDGFHVMSDGTVDAEGRPSENPVRVANTLAAYVRHLQEGK